MQSESFSIKVYFADEFQRNYRLRLFFLSPTTMQQTHHQRNFAKANSFLNSFASPLLNPCLHPTGNNLHNLLLCLWLNPTKFLLKRLFLRLCKRYSNRSGGAGRSALSSLSDKLTIFREYSP